MVVLLVIESLSFTCIQWIVIYFYAVFSTAENIAIYIWDQLKIVLSEEHKPLLYKVKLHETDKNVVTYRGE